ncbi:nucleotide-diphospho-sugar transferase [Cokeromyces recurvatus]|uniref:nucleotide-diphospho-sugar transferase n=1 Tax=Cokeromyces recurvatus TaxID=90255 RepID=UPI00221FBA9F|nr:nucleotide-diphospho-sugar transferase [Cokeromyces recurvatus]KAI7903889.1 nucleotide-diphospho-sugar transferase [Cokeromyces recurvatus]
MIIRFLKKQKILICSTLSLFIIITFFLLYPLKPIRIVNNKQLQQTTKEKACFVILIRNEELDGIVSTMSQIENTFNSKYHYPYIFLNDQDFTPIFIRTVSSITNARVLFGKLNETMWGYPEFINQTYAAECRQKMAEQNIPYATSESYRHMCRFQSGYFFRHPLLDEFDYYWRLEPYVDYYCQIDYDVFEYMRKSKKRYGFNIAYKEHIETVPSLWDTVMNFTKEYPQLLPNRNETLFQFVTSDNGVTYNTCHFWSNFEIGDLSLWRSEAYLKLFDYLDKSGGFYYERWGDAPVHSIAASLLLHKDEFHFFNDIGYRHSAYTHCPIEEEFRTKCSCDPSKNFDFIPNLSCLPIYKSALM